MYLDNKHFDSDFRRLGSIARSTAVGGEKTHKIAAHRIKIPHMSEWLTVLAAPNSLPLTVHCPVNRWEAVSRWNKINPESHLKVWFTAYARRRWRVGKWNEVERTGKVRIMDCKMPLAEGGKDCKGRLFFDLLTRAMFKRATLLLMALDWVSAERTGHNFCIRCVPRLEENTEEGAE